MHYTSALPDTRPAPPWFARQMPRVPPTGKSIVTFFADAPVGSPAPFECGIPNSMSAVYFIALSLLGELASFWPKEMGPFGLLNCAPLKFPPIPPEVGWTHNVRDTAEPADVSSPANQRRPNSPRTNPTAPRKEHEPLSRPRPLVGCISWSPVSHRRGGASGPRETLLIRRAQVGLAPPPPASSS